MLVLRKNTASQHFNVQLLNRSDGTDLTSGTPTVQVKKDGGAYANIAGSISHDANGSWEVSPTAADTNFDDGSFKVTLTNAITVTMNATTDPRVSLADNGITAAKIAASALNGKGDWNIGKAGYSLAADQSGVTIGTVTTNTDMRGTDSALLASSAPANFGDLAITATTGRVTVGTNNDKSGYSISGTKTTLDALNDITAGDVLSGGDIDGFTLEETQKLILSASAAKLSGAATSTVVIRAADDSKDRITATTSSDGDRTNVILDASG